MHDLTDRQRQVLDLLRSHRQRCGYPPTLRELAAALGVTGTVGVMKHLAALEKKGYIARRGGDSRGIVLREASAPAATLLPIVGTVRAGAPQPPLEDIEGELAVDPALLRSGGRFWLKVRGDSMIEAAIRDGDLALIRPQSFAADRDIVVALVDGEATLKRFFRAGDAIRLQPENAHLAPLVVPAEAVTIVGKVVALLRREL